VRLKILTDYRAERLVGLGSLIPLIEGGQGHELAMLGPCGTGVLVGALSVLVGLAAGGISLLVVPV